MKIFLLMFLFLNFLHGSILLDKNTPLCIEAYEYKNGRIYFQKSSNGNWGSTAEDHTATHLFSGYFYNSDDDTCYPEPYTVLGISLEDWNFLNALIGLLFGFYMLVMTTYIFVTVGGKK